MDDLLGGATPATETIVGGEPAEQGVVGGETRSIDDTLREAYAKLQDEAPDAPEDEEKRRAQPERARGPDGKFVKAEAAPAATPETPTTEAPSEATAPDKAAAPAFEDKGPPVSWRPIGKAAWDGLTPEVKAEVYKREEDFHKGIEAYKGKAQVADVLWSKIQPFEAVISAAGANIPDAIGGLLQTAATLQLGTPAQKQAALRAVAQQFGVDVGTLAQDNAAQPFVDPQVDAMQRRIAQLEGYLQQQQSASLNSEAQAAMTQIGQFANDPRNKYFADVRADMAHLLTTGRAASLQDAYDKACLLNDSVRQAVEAERRAAAEKERQAAAAKAAADARKRGAQSLRSTPLPGNAQALTGTIDDTLRARYRELNG